MTALLNKLHEKLMQKGSGTSAGDRHRTLMVLWRTAFAIPHLILNQVSMHLDTES